MKKLIYEEMERMTSIKKEKGKRKKGLSRRKERQEARKGEFYGMESTSGNEGE